MKDRIFVSSLLLILTPFVFPLSGIARAQVPEKTVTKKPQVSGVAPLPPQETLIKMRDDMKALPVFTKCAWTFDYEAARASAKLLGKPILAYFTRSYSDCPSSRALEMTTFSDSVFTDFADKVVLFCNIETRVTGEPPQTLFRETGGELYPHIVFLAADGSVLAKESRHSAASIRNTEVKIALASELAKKPAEDTVSAADLLILKSDLGIVTYRDARKRAKLLINLPADKSEQVNQMLIDLQATEILAEEYSNKNTEDNAAKLVEMMRANHLPTGENLRVFYSRIMLATGRTHDVENFKKALTGMEEISGDDEKYTKVLTFFRKRLVMMQNNPGKNTVNAGDDQASPRGKLNGGERPAPVGR
ncbi:MAG: thioredoxin family protein [Planctomycetota bacterium]|nr:thioredoxin family protein [Planctomycetota bacterium]